MVTNLKTSSVGSQRSMFCDFCGYTTCGSNNYAKAARQETKGDNYSVMKPYPHLTFSSPELHPFKQASVAMRESTKLAPKYWSISGPAQDWPSGLQAGLASYV